MAAFGGLTSAQPVNSNNDVAVRQRQSVRHEQGPD